MVGPSETRRINPEDQSLCRRINIKSFIRVTRRAILNYNADAIHTVNSGLDVRSDVLTAVNIQVDVFWVVTLCSVVVGYQTFWRSFRPNFLNETLSRHSHFMMHYNTAVLMRAIYNTSIGTTALTKMNVINNVNDTVFRKYLF
jgi:hypothetical protein